MSYFHNFVIFLEQQVTKKMLQPENMSLLKNMLPLSTAAHITKCARSPPYKLSLLRPVWTQTNEIQEHRKWETEVVFLVEP